MRRGEFEWSTIAKLILLLVILLVVLLIINLFKGGFDRAIENITNLLGL